MARRTFGLEEEAIEHAYLQGESPARIAPRYGVSAPTISKVLKKRGVASRLPGGTSNFPPDEIRELMRDREAGYPVTHLARKYVVRREVIKRQLARWDQVDPNELPASGALRPEDTYLIYVRLLSGRGVPGLALEWEVPAQQIQRALVRMAASVGLATVEGDVLSVAQRERLLDEFKRGQSLEELSQEYGLSATKLRCAVGDRRSNLTRTHPFGR